MSETELRTLALQMAIDYWRGQVSAMTVVLDTAKHFEKFLRGEND